MKLVTRQDIDAPLAFVWQQITDFAAFEHLAARRGAHIDRSGPGGAGPDPQPGQGWQIRFRFRGKPRQVRLVLTGVEREQLLDFTFDSPSFAGTTRAELMALSPARCRIALITEVKPQTLAARLTLQGLRLAKGRTKRKVDGLSAQLAQRIAAAWKAEKTR